MFWFLCFCFWRVTGGGVQEEVEKRRMGEVEKGAGGVVVGM